MQNKTFDEARKAVEKTPEYKAKEEAEKVYIKPKDEEWKAHKEATGAYWKAWKAFTEKGTKNGF